MLKYAVINNICIYMQNVRIREFMFIIYYIMYSYLFILIKHRENIRKINYIFYYLDFR